MPARAGLHMIEEGLWHWERRHPEWHPGDFGAVVGCYLVVTGGVDLLIDPLVDGDDDPVIDDLDALMRGPVRILISIPYHTRSAELLQRRFADRGALILGHPLVQKRLTDLSGFRPLSGDDDIDGVARTHRIGKPVRAEMPIEIPALNALVFGDAIVEYEGRLHLWDDPIDSDNRRKWYEERVLPTMRALQALDSERILVTHGRPVLRGGSAALKAALDRGPWPPRRA
jgi:hypothetical protein